MTLAKVYLPGRRPPHIMGTPCRLAPTANLTSKGNLAKSGQVVPASITSIISVVLVEEENGYPVIPEVIMTLESVDKKKLESTIVFPPIYSYTKFGQLLVLVIAYSQVSIK